MFKSLQNKIKTFLTRSDYIRDVLTLMTGTVIAQLIPLFFSPVISRIFVPDDFASFATYMSIISIFGSIATLRYEYAIILPRDENNSLAIVALSVIIAFLISCLLFLSMIFFGMSFLEIITNKKIDNSSWLFLIPLSVFTIGVYSSFNYWQNRKAHYKTLAVSRISQYALMTGAQIGFGAALMKSLGLILGEIAGRVCAAFILAFRTFKDDFLLIKNIRWKNVTKQFKRYKNFPMFSLPGDLINVFTNQVPILALGKYFVPNILGNYFFMDRIMNAPVTLIGKAVLDVFKQRASSDYIKYGNCKSVYIKTFKTLVVASSIPTLITFIFAPVLFRIIFGAEWELAGEFARIMALLFFFRLIASPLSYMFFIAEKQYYDMIWQVCLFLT
ncbi:MAG: lipopolysaccharide biosynthesis protein, partial [Bacteroidales bacterium]|nr:lipopolysaccharide biosynthesis protein [Bacteroidales bacterium]